jgi:DNA-binding response OmpR family regulator
MIRMVEQMLDLSRVNVTGSMPASCPWNLSEVTRMVVRGFADIADSRDIDLAWDIDGRWETKCNQEQVEKIILNLLSNALKFTPRGGRVVISLNASDGGVQLAVSDTGPGIPAEDQAMIFERFYRSALHQDQAFSGAGIGLALVKEAAVANGGHVSVDSQLGMGATFKVWLPAVQAIGPMSLAKITSSARSQLEVGVLSSEYDEADQHRSRMDESADDTTPTLLIVEDNADLREHLVSILADQWHCVEAADGRAGLVMARRIIPDVVLTDLMMPHMDGFQMLERLREDTATSHIPVLILSARHGVDVRLRSYALKADDVLGKPFSQEELRLRLARVLDAQKRLRRRLRSELNEGRFTTPEDEGGVVPLAERAASAQAMSDADHQLLAKLERWLVAQYGNEGIKAADMAEAVNLDLRALQRKLRTLVGHTPITLLNAVRLREARRMLTETNWSIQDIATRCGYASPQYFSRIFSMEEGMSPRAFRQTTQSSPSV